MWTNSSKAPWDARTNTVARMGKISPWISLKRLEVEIKAAMTIAMPRVCLNNKPTPAKRPERRGDLTEANEASINRSENQAGQGKLRWGITQAKKSRLGVRLRETLYKR